MKDYYKKELQKINQGAETISALFVDYDGNKTKHIGVNPESIPDIIEFLQSTLTKQLSKEEKPKKYADKDILPEDLKEEEIKKYLPLTEEDARQWLLQFDKEGQEIWQNCKAEGLIDAVKDNIKDFGITEGLPIYG